MATRPRRIPKYAPGYMMLPQQRDKIIMPVHLSLAAIETGYATDKDYNTMALFVNMAQEIALRMKTAPEAREAIDRGRLAIISVGKRFMDLGKFGFSGPEMLAVRECVTVGDQLLKRANSAILMAICAAVDEHLRGEA